METIDRGSAQADGALPLNPYGGKPSSGSQFPPYYTPTPSVRTRNNYFPASETLGEDEMRISFVGSCPFPPRRDQAGTCIMVELGNGDGFFFDFGRPPSWHSTAITISALPCGSEAVSFESQHE